MKVPEGWRKGKVQDLIKSLGAGVSVNSEDSNALSKYQILKTSCVSQGVFNIEESKSVVDGKEIERLKEPLVSDTIIISRMNTPALVGANAYIKEGNKNYYLPDRLWQAKPKGSVVMKWLGYWFASDRTRYNLSQLGTGTSGSMKNITKSDVILMDIDIPPLSEQEKIAEILSTWDQTIEQTERLKTNAEMHKKALMQQLLTGKKRFPEFEGEWEKIRLGDYAKIQSGGTPRTTIAEYYDNGKIPWVSIIAIHK